MTTTARQRTLAELKNMDPAQLADAYESGQLDDLLAGRDPAQLDAEALKGMSPEAINAAHREGRLNDLLGVKA